MKNLALITCTIILCLTSNIYCNNSTIIKKGYVNIATLIVDYESYAFEGGNISYYTCPDCEIDNFPISVNYISPGDFGGITFELASTHDTIFDATIIWMGTGQIYYPEEFSIETPFTNSNVLTNKPNDLRYMNEEGKVMTSEYLLNKADSAWNVIDSLEITQLFAEKGYESLIYVYPPTVGAFDPSVAKWLIFLYHNDKSSDITLASKKNTLVQITPNPAHEELKIELDSQIKGHANYKIFNQSGKLISKEKILGNSQTIDVSALNSGLYFLQLSDKNNAVIATEKVVIE